MKSFFPTILITLLLLAGASVQAQTKDEGPMTNAEVIKLVKAGFKEKTIVLIIASRIPNFDLSSDQMIKLKRAGVNENIIVAMLARQEGTDMPADDSSWGDDPFFNSKLDPKDGSTKGSGSGSDGSTNIFGSNTGSRQKNSTRTGNGSASGESNLSGSATVRLIKPPTEPGGTTTKLEKTKSLTNESIVELVEAGFSEGTIIRRIEQSPVEFDLAADKLDALRKKRVTDKVIVAMKAAMGEDK
jgi:hypothetical protein